MRHASNTHSHSNITSCSLQAPAGKRVLVNIVQVQARCLEGCWEDAVEFKMSGDPRPVGYRYGMVGRYCKSLLICAPYRYCCQLNYQRRILSRTNIVPFIVTSRNVGITLTFEYTFGEL